MGWWHGWKDRAGSLFRRNRVEREMREEMRFHLEMETEKLLRQGLDAREAKREAHRRFGGVEHMKERTRDERGTRRAEEMGRDVRYAVRTWRRDPGFAAATILTLALGIGATTATFSVLDGVLLEPLPFDEPDRLVMVREADAEGRGFFFSWSNFEDLRGATSTVEAMVATVHRGELPVLYGSAAVRAPIMEASLGLFEVLGVEPVRGRVLRPDENRPGAPAVAMVSWGFWDRHLGAPASLDGVTLEISGVSHRVVGVLPPGFHFFQGADVLLPGERDPVPGRGSHAYRVVARMADGADAAAVERELDGLMSGIVAEHPGETNAVATLVRPLDEELLGSQVRPLTLLMAGSILVLLVACTNLAGTWLARGLQRSRELSVRRSLGAGRGRLLRQLLTESVVLAGAGGVGGLVLAWVGVVAVRRFGPALLPRLGSVTIDGSVLAVAVGSALVASALFGLLPSLRLLAPGRPWARPGEWSGPPRRAGWGLLVGAESALAVVLLVTTGLLLRSLGGIARADVGFRSEGVLTARLSVPSGTFDGDVERADFLDRAAASLEALPRTVAVGAVSLLPLDAFNRSSPAWTEGGEPRQAWSGWRPASPGYFDAMGIRLVRGRLMDPDLGPGDPGEVVVNEALADALWPGREAVGQRMRIGYDPREEWLTVVGVVAEARLWSQPVGTQGEAFVSYRQRPEHTEDMILVARTRGAPATLVSRARARIEELSPRVAVRFSTLEEEVAATRADRRFIVLVLGSFGLVTLLLTGTGIGGIVAYTVSRRTREIGIRVALGARPGEVARRVQARTVGWVAMGVVVGVGIAAGVGRLASSLLYDVAPLDPAAFGAGVAVLTGVAAVAAWLPARRAAGVDPVEALRAVR